MVKMTEESGAMSSAEVIRASLRLNRKIFELQKKLGASSPEVVLHILEQAYESLQKLRDLLGKEGRQLLSEDPKDPTRRDRIILL